MKKLFFAIAFLVFGGLSLAIGPSAQAAPAAGLSDVAKAMPASTITKVCCGSYRYRYYDYPPCYYRPCYRPCGYYRPCYRSYYYRPYYRRPYYDGGCYRPYRRCWY